jgi:hypothetical protein
VTLAEKVRALLLAAGYSENERLAEYVESGGFELWKAPEQVTLLHVMPGGVNKSVWIECMQEYRKVLELHFSVEQKSYALDIREK